MESQFIRNSYKLFAGIIISTALTLAIISVWNDAFIVDEIPHVGAGYSYVTKGDYRLNPEHPPLAKDLAGLALLFSDVNQDVFASQYWTTDINGQWNFGRTLIFESEDAQLITRTAKMPLLLFFIGSALLVLIWTTKLYGKTAGLLALFLFSFSPTVIAHSRFVTTDMPALFGILLASFFFFKYLQNSSKKNLLVAGLMFGIAQLTKFSAFLLVPYFLLLALILGLVASEHKFKIAFKKLVSTAMVIIIGYIVVVWPVYGLHTMNYPSELQLRDTTFHLGSYGNRLIADRVVELSNKPVIRSMAQYGLGLLMVTQRSIGGNDTYFLGDVRNTAWKQYFPIVYFLKEPLAFWILILTILLFLSTKVHFINSPFRKPLEWTRNHFTEFAMLLWLAIYWYASITANLNIGVRHLLPTYGFVYILLAGQIAAIAKTLNIKEFFKAYIFIITALLGWYLYENISIFPYYLTYFNQVAGGAKGGYIYVVDSNLDWGQDLKRLADWIDKNNIQKIHLDYFGWSNQNYYLGDKVVWISAGRWNSPREFLVENPKGGYIAISKSFFMGSRGNPDKSYAWLDNIKPVADIGNSIFVWYISP